MFFLQDKSAISIALNFLLLPIGYFMLGLEHALYIPPAWSLGLELTFYLFFPFFWFTNKNLKILLVAASIAVATAALAGLINADWYGYRLLPGTFFIFIVGASFAQPNIVHRFYPAAVLVLAASALLAVLLIPDVYSRPYNKEVTAGIVIGVCVVGILRQYKFSVIDELLGNISYGIFLNHFLLMWLADHFGYSRLIVPVASVVCAIISYKLLEEPALRLRRRIRASRFFYAPIGEEAHAKLP